MKIKYLLLTMLITTSINFFGCAANTSNDDKKVLDSIVLDEDTKGTKDENSTLNVEMIAKTEGITGSGYYWGTKVNGKIIYYAYLHNEEETKVSQFPKLYLDTVKVGEITEEKDSETGLNKINWIDKEISGKVLQDFNNIGDIRIINNNKGYKFNSNGELEEITAYQTLLDKFGDNHSPLATNANGTVDLFWVEEDGTEKVVLIDTEQDKYYEIGGDVVRSIGEGRLTILAIEDNRIYVFLEHISTATYKRDSASIIGYIEGDKFTDILSPNSSVNVNIIGGAIYSNGRILFSGYAEDKNGIWNYDIKSKKLVRQIDVGDETFFNFNINTTKDKVMLSGSNYLLGYNQFTMNLGVINDNLEISNLTNIVSTKTKSGIKALEGWSEDGNEFYLYTRLEEKSEEIGGLINISYEVYKIRE